MSYLAHFFAKSNTVVEKKLEKGCQIMINKYRFA
jgi:hypothetical protein